MAEVSSLAPWWGGLATLALLLGGAYSAAVLRRLSLAPLGVQTIPSILLDPLRSGAVLLRQETLSTERPDLLLWVLAPATYAAAAAGALAVVPLGEAIAVADVRTGIVWFGAAEALAIVGVLLHGWSSNSMLSLIGGFRFVAIGLSYELLSMFALIAATLPAESLQVSAIVDSQAELWNVVRQPLGLPLWVIVTWGVTFSGPLNLPDGNDLASGTSLEASGRQLLLWKIARGAMLAVFSAMGAAIFLGGWHGPLLPGWAWMLTKTCALLLLVTWLGQRIGRIPADRAMRWLWLVGLPLSFAGLLQAGIEALS